MVKLPDCIANVLSPNGREKKHNLYNKHPNACQKKTNNTSLNKTNIFKT
jgi:hypothetical protein